MNTKLLLVTILLLSSLPSLAFSSHNQTIKTFNLAKKQLYSIHQTNPTTIYCGCKYTGKSVDLKSCGYKIHKNAKRAARLEWEHVVPAHAFGQSFKEWRDGDPKCIRKNKKFKGRRCAKTNEVYARMEADMYNLYPEIGELNGLRSNFSMASIGLKNLNTKGTTFGECKAIIQDRKFEPMDMAKGIVARTYMYMDQAYPGRGIISNKNRALFEAWNKMFPASKWECERAKRIREVQGNENPVLAQLCK